MPSAPPARANSRDRFGRRFVYQFNLLLFGIFTILGAFAPSFTLLVICRFIAGIGLGAEQPLAFAYAGEWAPKRIRGRILAIVHFIGGAIVWPIGTGLVLGSPSCLLRDAVSASMCGAACGSLIGILALIVWVFRFTLPESPRYLATHGRGDEAIKVLNRLGIAGPTEPLSTDAASNTKSDPFAVVFKMFPSRVIAGMICFTAFFGIAIGLGAWLPNIMNAKGFTITKSLQYTLAMNFAVPCASIFMMYALDKFGRKITAICAFIAAGVMAIVFANAEHRDRADRRRLHHDLLRPGRRQLDADFHVRGVSHQRARIGLRLGVGRRPARHGVHLADDLVGAERLGA